MLKTTLFFSRPKNKNKDGYLYLLLRKIGTRSYIPLIKIPQKCWNGTAVVNHKKANQYNKAIWSKKIKIEDTLEDLILSDRLIGKTAKESVELVMETLGLTYSHE